MKELLRDAESDVLVAGYQVSDEAVIIELGSATARGVTVDLFVDREQGSLDALRSLWPAGASQATVWSGDLRTPDAPYASLHAKAIVVDGKSALVTSANLTHNGLSSNLEIGLLIRGEAARDLRDILRGLATSDLLERETLAIRPLR